MKQEKRFDAISHLRMETSMGGVVKGSARKSVELECHVVVDEENTDYGGYFEFWDKETQGEKWHADGHLEISNKTLTGYDGVMELPDFIINKLKDEMGITIDL